MQTWFRRLAAAMLLTVLPVYAAAGYYAWRLPDSYYVRNGSALALSTALHITAESEPEQVKAAFSNTAATEEQYTLCLFGIVPIKTVSVQTITAPSFIPCGQPFGIKLHMDGVMVVGFGNVTSTDGTCCPAEDAGFQKGDMIHAINTVPVNSSEEVQTSIRNAGSEPLSITIQREGKEQTLTVHPVYSTADQQYETGLWVRDSTAGVGTSTSRKAVHLADWGIPSATRTPEHVSPSQREKPALFRFKAFKRAVPESRGCYRGSS